MIFDELRDIQHRYGYLPAGELVALSRRSSLPLFRIHGVADFYPHFRLTPGAKAQAQICRDISCHLRGASALRDGLRQRFRGMSEDDVEVSEVSCLGQCDGAPAMAINGHIGRQVTLAQAEALVHSALGGVALPEPPVETSGPTQLRSDPYSRLSRYGAARKLIETRDFDGVIAQLKVAGLGGMGGAGFPTGIKWDAVRKAPGPEKYVICNADESEPGTIKDRFILQRLTHLVVEGMLVAGLVTGARKGMVYIRHEYEGAKEAVDREIRLAYDQGLLGAHVLGSDLAFDLEIFVSPGGYICGEETALLEAMEGKRAEPRNKPPFPVLEGLWNKPTALNNVETFANVPQVLVQGVDWFKAQGRNGSAGLKFVGVSGDVRFPGVFEVAMGTPVGEVIMELAGGPPDGKKLKAFAPSGASSGFLPASLSDTPLDFKALGAVGSMLGSGAIVVVAEGRCMLDMALNPAKFFRHESCGKCVPCRVGTQKMVDLMTGWTEGRGQPSDLTLVEDLSEAMKLASICGLGQFAPMPLTSVLRHFRDEVEEHIRDHRCPEGVCSMGPG